MIGSLSHRDQGFVLKERLREACRLISQTEEQWRYYEGTLAIMIEGPYRMALRDTISVSRPGFRVLSPQEVPPHVNIETLLIITC